MAPITPLVKEYPESTRGILGCTEGIEEFDAGLSARDDGDSEPPRVRIETGGGETGRET